MFENVFAKSKSHHKFSWENLGDIAEGRGDLGEDMPVLVYRLMQYTMLDVLSEGLGEEEANEYFRKAGFLAGTGLAQNLLDLKADFNSFVSNLRGLLRDLRIGVLRMEAFDHENGEIVLTVGQDLDCSGLPITNETVCYYDEGFIAGILSTYTGKSYEVREVDCWASGDRVCRFEARVEEPQAGE
jgi:predicted hydrocarbon binding protein